MSEAFIVEINDLRKNFGRIQALRGLNLRVPAGSICGFLGKNGAGKTTALKILLGMIRPDSGEARVCGLDALDAQSSVEIRRRCAFVSDEKDLFPYMSVEGMIRFTAAFFPSWRGDLEQRYLRRFELPQERKVRQLSRGMRTKLALLLALCRGAELLLLDEPTSGLDPAMTEEVLQALVGYAADEEKTVFFSSHQIAEVEQVADRVAIVHHGKTAVEGAIDDLRRDFRRIELVFDDDAPDAVFHSSGVERVVRRGRVVNVWASRGSEGIIEEARRFHPVAVDVTPVTLKEIFLETVSTED